MSWRKNLNSMQKRMEAVMKHNIPDISHDVTFIVGEDEKLRISCHKLFLSIVSPVFEVMFSQRYDDSNNNLANGLEIFLPDVRPVGLRSIIKYAYTGILKINVEEAVETMYAADKYDIPELMYHCSQILQNSITIQNVMTIYQTSLTLNDDKLEEKALNFIQHNCGVLMESQQFLEFSEETLCDFLNLDHMPSVKSELDVFHAVLNWANIQCDQQQLDRTTKNLRTILNNVIPFIRFPVLQPREFCDFVQPTGILNSEECTELLKYLALSDERRISASEKMKYSCIKRTGLFVASFQSGVVSGKLLPIHSSTGYDRFIISGNSDKIKLKSVGVVLPRSRNAPLAENKTISIALKDVSTGIWTHTTKTVTNFLEICYIEFDSPVSIKPNVEYQTYVNQTSAVPVSVIVHPKRNQLMNLSWTTADKDQLIITFNPCHYIIWSLFFES